MRTAVSFSDVLQTLLPSAEETLLLQACLLNNRAGYDAYEAWQASCGDPITYFMDEPRGIRRLLPLLYEAYSKNQLPCETQFVSCLRTAYFREELRAISYQKVCVEALSALRRAQVSFILLKSAALAASVYPVWALRHCHDIDLLLDPSEIPKAVHALADAEYTSDSDFTSGLGMARYPIRLHHPSSLALHLHVRLYENRYYEHCQFSDVWSNTHQVRIGQLETHILAPSDALLHVCGHAAETSSRRTLCWVYDAWHILSYSPGLEWETFQRALAATRTALPIYAMLKYLRETLAAHIPQEIIDKAAQSAQDSPRAAYETALVGLRADPTNTVRKLFRTVRSPASMFILLKYFLFPAHFRLIAQDAHLDEYRAGRPLAVAYANRLLRIFRSVFYRPKGLS